MPEDDENKFRQRDQSLEDIVARLGVRAERGRRFAELTSLRVGGAIAWVLSPETEAQAAGVVHEMDQAGIGWRALGSSSVGRPYPIFCSSCCDGGESSLSNPASANRFSLWPCSCASVERSAFPALAG